MILKGKTSGDSPGDIKITIQASQTSYVDSLFFLFFFPGLLLLLIGKKM